MSNLKCLQTYRVVCRVRCIGGPQTVWKRQWMSVTSLDCVLEWIRQKLCGLAEERNEQKRDSPTQQVFKACRWGDSSPCKMKSVEADIRSVLRSLHPSVLRSKFPVGGYTSCLKHYLEKEDIIRDGLEWRNVFQSVFTKSKFAPR